MSAFRLAVLSVNPDRLEQFTNEMKKNISDKNSKKGKRKHRSPSDTSSSKYGTRKQHFKSGAVAKSSSQSTKDTELKDGKSSKSVQKNSRKRHKPQLDTAAKKPKDDSDFDGKELDLSNPISSLTTLVKDRKTLLETAFSIIRGSKLTAMLPSNLKQMPLDEVKRLCHEHLNVMSSKRVVHILSGTSMDSSSGTDSSDDEHPVNVEKSQDVPTQDHTLQTNLVDSTTSDNSGPSMLFPSALSTAQGAMNDKNVVPPNGAGFKNVPTSTSPIGTHVVGKSSNTENSEAEDVVLETFITKKEERDLQDIVEQVSEAKEASGDTEEVFVEEVEEIEEMTEDHNDEDFELQTADDCAAIFPQSIHATEDTENTEYYPGISSLEILELELRARAIRSLVKASRSGSLKTAPSDKS